MGVEGVGCRLALEEALAIKGGRDSREPLNRHVGVGILAGRKLCQRFPRTHDYPAGPRIGANGVKVPTYLYKLVYDATTNKVWAHWQQNREGETVGRPISYQELVKRTGVEFLPRSALQH